jgi:hypothetical protein
MRFRKKVSKPDKFLYPPHLPTNGPQLPTVACGVDRTSERSIGTAASYHYAALHQAAVPITSRSSRLRRLEAGFG